MKLSKLQIVVSTLENITIPKNNGSLGYIWTGIQRCCVNGDAVFQSVMTIVLHFPSFPCSMSEQDDSNGYFV